MLDLAQLAISTFKPLKDMFYVCTNIEHLNLGGNMLEACERELFHITNLQKLKLLDLSMNNFHELPPSFEQLTDLRTLRLGGNDFTTFPRIIRSLNNLQFLDIGSNNIHIIPSWILRLTNLEVLGLGQVGGFDEDSYTVEMPNMCVLSLLTDLDLSSSKLSDDEVPTWLFDLELEYLDLSCNRLSRLPADMRRLTKLKSLDLQVQGQSLNLPPEMRYLSSLTRLNLGTNIMHNDCLRGCENVFTKMQVFSLHNCDFTSIPTCVQGMSSLTKLELVPLIHQ
eukprot:752393-Hanusia_phi.AAC.8